MFKDSTWDQVDRPAIKSYLKARTAKTQGNREMSLLSIIWNWARVKAPRACLGLQPAWGEGEQLLRDCMDLSTATGMRLTDCINVLMPRTESLRLEASKTGKESDYDLNVSQVLPGLVARRKSINATHTFLLSTMDGERATHGMLPHRYDQARNQT